MPRIQGPHDGMWAGMVMEFCVLGPLEVRVDAAPVPVGGPRQRALLAFLLLSANSVVSRDRLIAELFDESSGDGADHALRMQISRLRKALDDSADEPSRLLARPPGYLLRVQPGELDLERFEELVQTGRSALQEQDYGRAAELLTQADRLWRGRAFADVEFEPFVRVDVDRLEELRIAAIEHRIDAELALGRHGELVAELESRVAENPVRERLRAQLMLALYRCGRQAEALDAYRAGRAYLHDELGIEPNPGIRELEQSILRQDPGLDLMPDGLRGYRLMEKICERPYGAAYRAIQPRVERDVVVEIFETAAASEPGFADRFEHESRTLAELDHPHLVPIYDHWSAEGKAYLVVRFMRGGSLRDLEERTGTPAPERAKVVIEQIASGLAYAHDHGVAHGRVRQAAVLFDAEHNAYLGDFQVGTGDEADPASDVRALALLIRQLLGSELNAALAELCRRAEIDVTPPSAGAFVSAARAALGHTAAPLPDVDHGARNPYKGLRSYTEADAGDFFGRAALVDCLVQRLTEPDATARFLAVVGPSGSGKSSVVRAGLIPAIRNGAIGAASGRLIAEMRPGTHPIDELEAALLRVAQHPPARLFEILAPGSRGLLDAVSSISSDDEQLVLVIDQFEEVFSLCQDEHERDRFFELLRVAAVDPDSCLRVIITLRADFYDRPLRHPRFAELLAARTQAVPPLTPDELEHAIRGPCEQIGVTLESGLVAEMIAEVAHQPGALPLLQYALTELFERRVDGQLQLGSYREIGGVTGALSARADRLLSETTAVQRRAAEQVFLRLVALGEGVHDTRRRVLRSELDDLEVDHGALEHVLSTFGRHRLLTFDRDSATNQATVEIAHEALLVAWRPLGAWIEDARQDLRQQQRLSRQAAEWEAGGLDPSLLMRGAYLEQVEAWRAESTMAIGRLERAYLDASALERDRERAQREQQRAHELHVERRARRRLRALVVVFAAAAVAAGVLTAVARDQTRRASQQARLASARELAAASGASLQVDPERSILLAIEAVRLSRAASGAVIPEAEAALHNAIAASRIVLSEPGDAGPVAWGTAGTFAQESPHTSGTVEIRNASTGRLTRDIRASTAHIESLAFSPDGSRLATASDDGQVRIWDLSTGARILEVAGQGSADAVSFSADGSLLVAVWGNGTVQVLRAGTSDVVWQREVDGAADATLSPDGRRIAVITITAGGMVLDLRTGRQLFAMPAAGGLQGPSAAHISWSPDGRSIAGTARDGALHVWDAATGADRFAVRGQTGHVVALAWNSSSTGLVTGGTDGTAKVWTISPSGVHQALTLSGAETSGGVWNVAYSPDGSRVITSGQDVGIWDLRPSATAEWADFAAESAVPETAFLPGGGRVVAASSATSMSLWDVTKHTQQVITVGQLSVEAFAVDPSNGAITVGGRASDHRAPVSLETIDSAGRQRYATDSCCDVTDVAYSPDGKTLAAAGADRRVTIFDAGGRVLAVLAIPGMVAQARFRPGSSQIATVLLDPAQDVNFAQVSDWRSRTVVWADAIGGDYVSYDATGTRMVVTDQQGRAEIVDAADGRTIKVLAAPPFDIEEAAFSPDGSYLATAGADGSVRFFDARTGTQTTSLPSVACPVSNIAFSPDGTRLASVSACDGVRVWALDIDDLLRIAQHRVTRSLTAEECRQYLHQSACPTSN